MAKGSKGAVAEKPAKASKKNVQVEDEDEEEEEAPVKAKASSKTATKGKAETKTKKKVVKEDYAPNKNSMRDFIMRAMKKGGTSQAIKKRAATLAEKAGVDDFSDAKSFKNFDVAYFAKMLATKGFDVEIDEEADTYTLSA